MLKKLLKYEFKSVSKILTPLLLGTLVLSLISSILFTVNYRYISRSDANEAVLNVFGTIIITVFVFSLLAIIASFLVVLFILLHRYYKSFFGDEGYLTFTLPVKVEQHLFAKLISGFVWMSLSALTITASVLLLIAFGTAESGEIINISLFREIQDVFRGVIDYIGTANTIGYITECFILLIVALSAQLLLYYLAITIGSIIAKKHKIIASIGVYLGINTILSTIMNIILFLLFRNEEFYIDSTFDSLLGITHLYMIVLIVLLLGMGITAFLISRRMLKKNLNLE